MANLLGLIARASLLGLLLVVSHGVSAYTVTYGGDPMECQAAVIARNDCMDYAHALAASIGAPHDNWHCDNNNDTYPPDYFRKWFLKRNNINYSEGGISKTFTYKCGQSVCSSGASYGFPWPIGGGVAGQPGSPALQYCYEGCVIVLDHSYGVPGDGELIYMVTGDECAECDVGVGDCCPIWETDCGDGEGGCTLEEDPECYCSENPNAWQCEDDEEPGPGEAVGCEMVTPDCGGLDPASCQIMIRTHRTHCAVENLIDVQTGARTQVVAKLEDIIANNSAAISAQTTALSSKLDQVKDAIGDISPGDINVDVSDVTAAVESGTTATTGAISSQTNTLGAKIDNQRTELGGKIDGQTGTLGGKLDQIKTAVQGISPGNINVDNSEVVAAVQNQTAQIIGTGVDPGDGVTQGDLDALTIRSVTGGPVGPSVVDMAGYLGKACPTFPSFSIAGIPWEIDNTLWCQFLSIINACMHLLAAWWAVMILLGK